ncbi:MAG TPA: DUF4349 domain-containing protein [Caulobacteraceae bacterium]|nr:DUF4349 domain-containing protein [Caulobacteraceae bacterium]
MNRKLSTTAIVVALAAVSLTACKKADLMTSPPPGKAGANAAASDASAAQAADATTSDASEPDRLAASPTPSPPAPMLAMAYHLGLAVPSDQVRPLMESHQEACERAGTDQCQVLAASADAQRGDHATASLTLRATPAWMRVFRSRAEADAKDLGGRIEMASTEGDDLGVQITDNSAAQQARAAEQARLAELMQRRTRNLDDTLQVEQEITRVQGEMNQVSSELAAMKNRIAMETVTIGYESTAMASAQGDAAPLAQAAHGFLGNVYAVLAALVTIASFALPFALIGAPLVWWAKRRKPQAAAPVRPATVE